MTTFERVKKLANNQGKNLKTVATDLGFSENAIYKWKTQSPNTENLAKVADYFGVSTDYLLGRTAEQNIDGFEDEDLMEIAMMFRKNEEDIPEDKREQFRKEVEKYIRFVKSELEND